MIWAEKNLDKIRATPKEKAICPICKKEVIDKCGLIKIWHWAHIVDYECDSFGEPESEWHLNWKNYFSKDEQEIIINNHRADIKTKNGIIIELQNSPLSPQKIIERELFYQNMIWIINGETLGKNFGCLRYNKLKGNKKFNWKWLPKSWLSATKPIFVDISSWDKDILFKIDKLNENGLGDGLKISKSAFLINHSCRRNH